MLAPGRFIDLAAGQGFDIYTGVPCSYLTSLINCAIESDRVRYIGAANEGDAAAIASGATVGGHRAVVLMQNSGLGNAVNPLSSLNAVFDIPVLLIVTHRGDPEGAADEPQHRMMGGATGAMLDLLGIPWSVLPDDNLAAQLTLRAAVRTMDTTSRPVAFVVKKDTFAPHPLTTQNRRNGTPLPAGLPPASWPESRPVRRAVLQAVVQAAGPADVIIATTGYTGRVLHEISDRPGQLALVGSMGCAAPFGLGLALVQPARRVIVLDGDGAILMRMGALATIGYEAPPNLVHVCLDNEVHDSTGGQATVSDAIDLAQIASACRYAAECVASADGLANALERRAAQGPRFLHIKTAPGESSGLSRPAVAPAEAARRLREYLRA